MSATAHPKPRETHAERREKAERAILKAAVTIISEKGLEAFTLLEAGERAGYSRALPAHYFQSKEGALAAISEYIVASYRTRLANTTNAPAAPPQAGLETLLKSLHFYFDDISKDRTVLRAFHALLAAAAHDKTLWQTMNIVTEGARAAIAGQILAGIEKGEIRPDIDPETEAICILGALRGIAAQWVMDAETTNIKKAQASFIKSTRRALQA